MTQQRVYDFGALLTQARTKTLAQSLFTPGIYVGLQPTVVSGTLVRLAAGKFLLPNGILVGETGVIDIVVPTPVAATDYTVTIDHDDVQATGGSPATYTLRTGILARSGDPSAKSLAVLWIRHTGSTPLTSDMLSVPPTLQAGSLLSAIENGFIPAPFAQACDVVQGSNILATQVSHSSGAQNLGLLVANSAVSGLQTYQFRLPLPPRPAPRQVQVFADIPALGSISLDTGAYALYAADGTAIATTPTVVAGAVTALDPGAAPAGSFVIANYESSNAPVSLGVTITVPAATSGVFLRGFNLLAD